MNFQQNQAGANEPLTRDETFEALRLASLISDGRVLAPTRLISPLVRAVSLSMTKKFRDNPTKFGLGICQEAREALEAYPRRSRHEVSDEQD